MRWILDPIDGTVNYLYGLPQYAVSLAAEVDGVVVAGVVRNAATGDEWTATLGGGAWRGGRRLDRLAADHAGPDAGRHRLRLRRRRGGPTRARCSPA